MSEKLSALLQFEYFRLAVVESQVRAFKPKIDRFLSCRKLKNKNGSDRQHPRE
jgi:hypothetical protein